ncbi:AbfB domain-containing protein [Acetivibrio saccincola]|uniref:RsgI N-terminal anti-sigma domain-containing protein n=1 Tax=Acetivibrio saccincola TaxID=1677857 RepID=A0A2S8RAW4_9FIRM|nr:AbfB domain-containing protein [Acetivibrio saccincola]NLW28132.1 anti-sigma factor domain-containing protein [Acetivibrio saccincola]PQQ66932.1 hypothetical protein B9R14_09370 [Acetivibrio saccincola]HOA96937.1 AbfB domain-containing protein [Acetivibrio saccincola]HQD29906.1 AbfB domain-containing protein [Acetivibrio saccincola]
MKYKGIVIKLTKNKAIVTTEDFQCYYIKRSPTICVGKEVEFTGKEIIKKKHALVKLALSAACIILVIIGLMSFTGIIDINNILYSPRVFAYISVDINPGFEMEIDYEGRVLNLVALDDDAGEILNNIEFDKVNISKVIDNMINELKAKGEIGGNTKDYILISSTLNWKMEENNSEIHEKRQRLDIIINEMKNDIENRYKADVYLLHADIEEREDAISKGISTGRYIAYKSLENELSIEDVKEAAVANLIEMLEKGNTDSIYRRFESSNYRGYYIRTESFRARISPYVDPIEDSIFKIVPGLAAADCISFESMNYPGYYLKHENFELILKKYEDTDLFKADATFRIVPGLADGSMISFQSFNYPNRYIRHREFVLYIEEIFTELDKKDATFIEIKVE